jgi:glutamyl-tRNA synthetase
MEREGAVFDGAPPLAAVLALMKERTNTINELADAAMLFYRAPQPDAALLTQHLTEAVRRRWRSSPSAAERWSGPRKRWPR